VKKKEVFLERFGRALHMRWLWGQWKGPDKPRCGSELPIDDVDRALFTAATQIKVRNGRTSSFWMTPWVQGNTLVSMFPNLFRHSRRKNRSVAAALADETWIKDLMHDVTPDMLGEYIILWMLIDEVAFDPTDQQSGEVHEFYILT
jgi:hypothetical protein